MRVANLKSRGLRFPQRTYTLEGRLFSLRRDYTHLIWAIPVEHRLNATYPAGKVKAPTASGCGSALVLLAGIAAAAASVLVRYMP